MRRKLFVVLAMVLTCAALLLTACGGNRERGNAEQDHQEQDWQAGTAYGGTLSVHALYIFEAVLRHEADELNAAFEAEGRYFNLELTTFGWDDRGNQQARLQTMIMAGQGYDLYIWEGLPIWLHSGTGLFANIYDLIDQCPNSSRDDFFTHVLEAWEIGGGLYNFPMSFEFASVAINATLPESIIEQFTALSYVSIPQLLQIYLDLQARYGDEFWHLTLGTDELLQRIPRDLFNSVLGEFIDFDNSTSSINSAEFVDFLNNLERVTDIAPDSIRWELLTAFHWSPIRGRLLEDFWFEMAENTVFMFRNITDGNERIIEFIDIPRGHEFFTHFIPLACTDGNLILNQFSLDSWGITEHMQHHKVMAPDFFFFFQRYVRAPAWGSVSIGAGANSGLAWEFTQQLLNTIANYESIRFRLMNLYGDERFRTSSFRIPIRQADFHPIAMDMVSQLTREIGWNMAFEIPPQTPEQTTAIREDIVARMAVQSQMPVVFMPYLPGSLYEAPMQNFLLGIISAQEAANQIHNRVALWLIE